MLAWLKGNLLSNGWVHNLKSQYCFKSKFVIKKRDKTILDNTFAVEKHPT